MHQVRSKQAAYAPAPMGAVSLDTTENLVPIVCRPTERRSSQPTKYPKIWDGPVAYDTCVRTETCPHNAARGGHRRAGSPLSSPRRDSSNLVCFSCVFAGTILVTEARSNKSQANQTTCGHCNSENTDEAKLILQTTLQQ